MTKLSSKEAKNRLKERFKQVGYEKLGKKFGVTRQTVWYWVEYNKYPTHLLKQILTEIKMPCSEFLELSEAIGSRGGE